MLALLALVGGAWAIDGAVNGSRIYDGVSVGAVDVSGMTEEEARRAVSSFYEPRVADGRALIFASEEARDTLDVESELAEQDAQAEQLSLEEARANKQVWVAESGTLGARLSVSELVSRAFAVGRDGGLAERMEAARNGVSVDVALSFDEEALEALCSSIDESAGEPRLDYGIAIEAGAVSVTEGHGGKARRPRLGGRQLSEGFLGEAPGKVVIVATPMRRTCASAPMRPLGSPTRSRRPSIGAAPSPSSRPSGRWGGGSGRVGAHPGGRAGGGLRPGSLP